MAFQNKNFSVVAYANRFTLWRYSSSDNTLAEIETDGYFNPIDKLCAVGDIIVINATDTTGMRRIVSIDDGKVKLAKLS